MRLLGTYTLAHAVNTHTAPWPRMSVWCTARICAGAAIPRGQTLVSSQEKGGLFFAPGILPSPGSVLTSERSLGHRPALSEHLSSLATTAFLCCVQCCEGLAEVGKGRPVSWAPASGAHVLVVVECVLFLVMSLCLLNIPKILFPKGFSEDSACFSLPPAEFCANV